MPTPLPPELAAFPRDCRDRFHPVRLIAAGGFGAVFEATQIELSRPVAVKVLLRERLTEPEQIQRFVEEARITAAIEHPHVIKVIDSGAQTEPWIAYEFIAGKSLRHTLEAHTAGLDLDLALTAAIQVADALTAAHACGILHRDIKPENVLEAEAGLYKVTDFGIAKWTTDMAVRTATGVILGSPAYIAPELVVGGAASPASDIYAVGVTLYELLTGQPPYADQNPILLLERHLRSPIPLPSSRRPRVAGELDSLVSRALQKKPADRQTSAAELMAELVQVRACLTSMPSPPSRLSGRFIAPTQSLPVDRHEGVAPTTVMARPRVQPPWLALAAGLALLIPVGLALHKPVTPLPSPPPPRPTPAPISGVWNRYTLVERSLGEIFAKGQRGAKAMEALRRETGLILPDSPENWLHWYRLGVWLRNGAVPDQAPKPRHTTEPTLMAAQTAAYLNMLNSLAGSDQLGQIALLVRWLRDDPVDPRVWWALGWALDADGQEELSRRVYRHAATLAPFPLDERWPYIVCAGRVAALIKNREPLEAGVRKLLAQRVNPNLVFTEVERLMNDSAQMVAFLDHLVEDPRVGALAAHYQGYSCILAHLGRKAHAFWQAGLARHPGSQQLRTDLVNFALERGQMAEARKYLPIPDSDFNICYEILRDDLNWHHPPAPPPGDYQAVLAARALAEGRGEQNRALIEAVAVADSASMNPWLRLQVALATMEAGMVVPPLTALVESCLFGPAPRYGAATWKEVIQHLSGKNQEKLAERWINTGPQWTPHDRPLAQLTCRALLLSRHGRIQESLDELARVRKACGTLFSWPWEGEILARAIWWEQHQLVKKLRWDLFSPPLPAEGPPLRAIIARALRAGDYRQVLKRAEEYIADDPHQMSMFLISLWMASLLNDRPHLEELAQQTRAAIHYHRAGKWMLDEVALILQTPPR